MVLQVKQETEEEIQASEARKESLSQSVTDKLKESKTMNDVLQSLDLPPEPKEETKPKSVQEEEAESEQDTTEEETQDQEETNQEDTEEEVIPKSKVQKRFDELTAKNKYLEQQIEEIRASKVEPKDEISRQLEAMTHEQLKTAKMEVRKAQIRSQGDDTKLDELIELEYKIDTFIQNAPANFQKAQQEAYTKKVQQIAMSGEIPNLESVAPQITKLANDIYTRYLNLQKDVNGQAIALELAVDHFKAMTSVPGDKAKETELKRQNNNLKRKVTLDTKTGKSNLDKSRLDSLKRNAIGGTMNQKVELVKSHPMFNVDKMIPEEFKQ